MPLILCEGPRCNAGRSATDREAAIVRSLTPQTEAMRDDAAKHARSHVSGELTLRPHTRCGVGRGGTLLYQCAVCRHERVYGTTMWTTW